LRFLFLSTVMTATDGAPTAGMSRRI
jgi:hypothetical protein